MLELNAARKIKINLADYDFASDIKNRIFISQFSALDLAVLEEILYSPIKTSLSKFTKNTNLSEKPTEILDSLKKLSQADLLTLQKDKIDEIIINKNVRKYFDFQALTFEEDFKPDLEFIQSSLKKIPIHILPLWYALPKTSNSIFQAIIDKFLFTPTIFFRHLEDIQQKNPIFENLINEVFNSPSLEAKGADLKSKYALSDFEFHEHLLFLEFSFVLCLRHRKTADGLEEIVTPFEEWKNYLKFSAKTQPLSIKNEHTIKRDHPSDFGFLEDLTVFLQKIEKKPLFYDILTLSKMAQKELAVLTPPCTKLLPKALFLKLVEIIKGKLKITDLGAEFIDLPLEKKGLKLLEKPANFLPFSKSEIKTAMGSISRALNQGWLYLDEFIKGVITPLKEEQSIKLTRTGKNFEYVLPSFSEEEHKLFSHVISNYLYESGITATGIVSIEEGRYRKCFKVTDFGKNIFEL